MQGKILELQLNILGKLQGSLGAAVRNAQTQMQRLGKAVRESSAAFKGNEKDLAQYAVKLAETQRNAQKFAEAQRKLTELSRQMTQGGGDSSALARQYQRQAAEVRRLQTSLQSAGFSTQNFADSERRLQAEIERTTATLQRQENRLQALNNFSNARGNLSSAVSDAQTLMSPFKGAVDNAMNFEYTMSKVKALTQGENIRGGNTEQIQKEMAQLESQARQLGATTQYTMTQAAESMTFLGMAGWKTEQIYNAMPGMLNLATASGSDLARTADIVSDNMTAMGLEAGKMVRTGKNLDRQVEASAHFMDVYAYAMSNSNVNLETLGETMKYAAPIANAYGATLEDAAAMTMIMGNAGVKGSMAGTAMRMGLLRLSGPPKKASKEMEELGISMSDATKMAYETQAQLDALGISLDENASPADKMFQVLTQLSEKTAGLGKEEKLAAVSAIFGANAATGWVNVLEQGPEVFQKYRDALRDCDGYAEQFAGTMKDNTQGAVVALESAIDAVSNSIGTALLPFVRKAVEAISPLVTGISNWISENQGAVQWAFLLAGGLSAVMVAAAGVQMAFAAWGVITSTIAAAKGAILGLRAVQIAASAATGILTAAQWALNAALTLNPVGLVIAALVLLIGVIVACCGGFDNLINLLSTAWNNPAGAIEGFSQLIKSKIDDAVNYVLDRWNTLKEALSHPLDAIMNFVSTGSVVGENVKSGEQIRQAQTNIPQSVINSEPPKIDTTQAQAQVDQFGGAVQQNAAVVEQVNQNISATGLSFEGINSAVQPTAESLQLLNQNVQPTAESLQLLNQNVSPTAESLQQVNANFAANIPLGQQSNELLAQANPLTQQSNELTTQNNSLLQQAAAAIQQFIQALAPAASEISQLGSAAQSAVSGISQLGAAAQSAVSQFQNAASQVASAASSANVAHNAEGGIYRKGEFLTTFAEKSPEAAIPLDGSQRAFDLWQQVGKMMKWGSADKQTGNKITFNQSPPDIPLSVMNLVESQNTVNLPTYTPTDFVQPSNDLVNMPEIPYETSGGEIKIDFSPKITVQGNADDGAIARIESIFSDSKAELEKFILSVIEKRNNLNRRISFV